MRKYSKNSQIKQCSNEQTQLLSSNYFLIGPMGSGKSTVGRLLAKKLGYLFIDTDSEVEAWANTSIANIFKNEGERYFREYETMILSEVSQKAGIVLATGGGIVLNSINRCYLSARGKVIYLQTSLALQHSRTQGNDSRPLLLGENSEQLLSNIFLNRKSLYEGLADWIVTTDKCTPDEIAERLYKHIKLIK
jgi:shikimate kinase